MKISRRRAIVVLTPAFPASEEETWWLPALQAFVKSIAIRNPGIAVHVVAFQYPYNRSSYTWHTCEVHALAGNNRRFPMRFMTWLRAAITLRRILRTHDVIALHSQWLAECTFVGSWISGLTGIRQVATIHGQDALPTNPYLKFIPLNRMTITAVSETAAEEFFKCTGRRVDLVVPIGLDSEALAPIDEGAERPIDVLGAGSLIPLKDFYSFLEIISEVRRQLADLRCVIIGEGPERPRLEGFIQQHGLREVVRLAGQLPRQSVLQTMRQTKILLHTSQYEGQGYIFLEALAAGMRVVCRDVGYAGNSSGVYRCESNSEMTQKLLELLACPMGILKADVMTIEQTAAVFERIYGTPGDGV